MTCSDTALCDIDYAPSPLISIHIFPQFVCVFNIFSFVIFFSALPLSQTFAVSIGMIDQLRKRQFFVLLNLDHD